MRQTKNSLLKTLVITGGLLLGPLFGGCSPFNQTKVNTPNNPEFKRIGIHPIYDNKSGRLLRVEFDDDLDGEPNSVYHYVYDKSGILKMIEYDKNADGVVEGKVYW